ncbi:uncharacterized protein LOC132945827 [Metopolophium dirhodum]|uniref:uncharacterized protein LOC132945827 n=1 Tax=Metopolophium dirhodum TaxID=44670 RepID=UPI00298F402D|nr:uncharacterized protein LOC132945827 [Metopolophium dirhodum]
MTDLSAVAVTLETSSPHTITTTTTSTVTAVTTTTTTTITSGIAGLPAAGVPNREDARRLFMGNLPKVKSEVEICEEVSRNTDGLVRVITYKNFENPLLHRGFCFLDYESSTAAAEAKRRLSRCTVFGCKTIVDWADPEPEVDAQQMATVRILFVRQYGGTLDERTLADVFGRYGKVERVKNLKNYSFIHFERRSDARDAMNALDGAVDEASGVRVDVSWAKPPAEKRIREQVLRDRERRIRLQAYATPRTEHDVVPNIRFNNKTTFVATTSSFTSNTNTSLASVPLVPYSNYDHYEYNFGRKTYACTCRDNRSFETDPLQRQPEQQRRQSEPQPEQRQNCQCIVGTSVDSDRHSAERVNRYAESGRTWRQQQRMPLQQRDTVETHFAGSSTARHDHGDCANDISDLDSIILNFFHKMSHTT